MNQTHCHRNNYRKVMLGHQIFEPNFSDTMDLIIEN